MAASLANATNATTVTNTTPANTVCITVPTGPQGPTGSAGPPGATGAAGMSATGVVTDANALSVASGGVITFSALQTTTFCLKLTGTAPATSLVVTFPNTPFVKVVDGSQANMTAATTVLFLASGTAYTGIQPVQKGASYIVEYDGVVLRVQQIGAPLGTYATNGNVNPTGVTITADATYHTLVTTSINVVNTGDKVKVRLTSAFATSTTTYAYYQLQIDGSPVFTDQIAGGATGVFGTTVGTYSRNYYTTSLAAGSHSFTLLVQNTNTGTWDTAGHCSPACGPDTIMVEASST